MNNITEQLNEYSRTCSSGFSVVTRDWTTHLVQTFIGVIHINDATFMKYTVLGREFQLQFNQILLVCPELAVCNLDIENRKLAVTGSRTGTVYLILDI